MAQIRVYDLLGPIRQVCRGCPTTVLNEAYINAVRQFCHHSKWFISTLPGQTVAGTKTYNLGSDPYSEIIGMPAISLAESATMTRALNPGTSVAWDPDDTSNIPEEFEYVPEAQFSLHPTPNAIYDVTVSIALQPKIGANSIEEALVPKWDVAFRAGALASLLRIPGMAWTDKAEANAQEARFIDWKNKGASSAARRESIGVVPW
jgi:hypothetical protein